MTKQKIALGMILSGAKEEAPMLAKCLASISNYVDAVYLNLNCPKGKEISPQVRKVAEMYTDKIFVTEWKNNFVESRNFIFKKIPKEYDWLMWLDSDDTVFNPAKIKDIINVAPDDIQGIFAQYDYDHDEYGNCTVTHRIVRLIRNNGSFTWKASFEDEGETVHEIPTETRTVKKAYSDEFKIIHHSTEEKRAQSIVRNICLLERMYERQSAKKEVDPRVLYYLGREYFNANNFTGAEPFLIEYIKASGWAEERAEAWLHLGLIWESFERNDAARQAFGHSFLENPKSPRALVELGRLEFHEKRYNMSEEFLKMAIEKEVPQTAYAVFPMDNKYRAYMLLAQTYINMGFGKLKEAEKYVDKALKMRPTDPDAKEAQRLVVKLRTLRNRTQAIMRLANLFKETKEPDNTLSLLNLLPDSLQDNPVVVTLRQSLQKPKKWPKKSIAIFCGNSAEDIWGPWGLEDGGMGGSEEAVIQLSSEITKQGWDVTVYATPGAKAGDYEGVHWKQYWEFNPKDEFDVFIAWRMPWFFDIPITSRKSYLWLHDVMDKAEFTVERLENLDKVIFVSRYHAELYKETIPESKWFVSGNGIDPAQFEKYDGIERDEHRCLYTSSHPRGLEILYDVWPDVLKAVPDAKLDVYYGWKTYDNANKDNPERMSWRDKMVKKAKELQNVTDHGRINHDQIAREMSSSGILAYPCIFPEVYCISLIKAMASGMYPVTSDYAVLKDFNTVGVQVHLPKDKEKFKKQYKSALIKALLHHEPNKDSKQIRIKYSWQNTSYGWSKEFGDDKNSIRLGLEH